MSISNVLFIVGFLFGVLGLVLTLAQQKVASSIMLIIGLVVTGNAIFIGTQEDTAKVDFQSSVNSTFGEVSKSVVNQSGVVSGNKVGSIELLYGHALVITPPNGVPTRRTVSMADTSLTLSGSITPKGTSWCVKYGDTAWPDFFAIYNQNGLVSSKAGVANCAAGVAYDDTGGVAH